MSHFSRCNSGQLRYFKDERKTGKVEVGSKPILTISLSLRYRSALAAEALEMIV